MWHGGGKWGEASPLLINSWDEKKKSGGKRTKGREKKNKNGVPLLSKIYRNRVVGFHLSKRQSSST